MDAGIQQQPHLIGACSPDEVTSLLRHLPPSEGWSASARHQLAGYGNALTVFTATAVPPCSLPARRLIAKFITDEPPLRGRLELAASLAAHVNAQLPGCVPAPLVLASGLPYASVSLGGVSSLGQLLEYVDSLRLYDVLIKERNEGGLLHVAHAFGLALGGLARALASARPTVLGGAAPPRVLAGCDALASGGARAPGAEAEADRIGSWDLRHVGLLARNLPAVADPATASLLRAALAMHAEEVAPFYAATEAAVAAGSYDAAALGAGLWRLGWVHGDANNHNVLVRGGGARDARAFVFIDWEDTAFSYAVHEVAISLTYLLLDAGGLTPGVLARADPRSCCPRIAAACAFVRGCSVGLPLSPCETAALPALVVSRLATSLLQSAVAAAAAGSPEQREYILLHAAPARALMQELLPAPARSVLGDLLLAATAASRPPAAPAPAAAYVYAPRLSPAQAAASRLVACALPRLRAPHSVIQHEEGGEEEEEEAAPSGAASGPRAPEAGALSAAAGASPQGSLPGARLFAPAVGDPPWPRAPFVYDFSPANAPLLRELVGTDPARLARFTELMFQPLAAPAGAGGAASAARARPAPASPEAPALTPPTASGGVYRMGWGRYGESRVLYTSEHFASSAPGAPAARTVHLGVDLEAPAGTPVRAPLAGAVHSTARNLPALDYGPTVILRHELAVALRAPGAGAGGAAREARVAFYTLYGHLSLDSLVTPTGAPRLLPGQAMPAGACLGWVGPEAVNGGWPPHLHLQLNTEAEHGGWRGDYPGVCAPEDWPAYTALCPDPNMLLRCPFVAPIGWAPGSAPTTFEDEEGVLWEVGSVRVVGE